MALDPSISLQATNAMTANNARPSFATQSPMETIGQFATIQNQLNTNRLFQQEFAAKKRAGEIMGSVDGDIDAAYDLFRKDPLTAAFADPLIASSRATQQVLTSIQHVEQQMAQKPLEAFTRSLGSWLSNPTSNTWDKLLDAQLAGLDARTQKRVKVGADALKLSLLDDLPEDPQAMAKTFLGRANGLMLGAGMTPEAMAGLLGTPETQDVGGQVKFGVQAPAYAGGGFEATNELQKTLAPQIQNLGNRAQVVGGGAGQGQANAMMGLPPTPITNPAGGTQVISGLPGAGAAPQARPAALAPTAHGETLNVNVPGPFDALNRDINGNPILTGPQARAAERLAEQYVTTETERFQGAQETQRAMSTIIAQLDTLHEVGGFAEPGQWGEQRLAVAKGLNAVVEALGLPPIFDKEPIGAAEGLIKESGKAAFSGVTQSFGMGREAQSIVETSMKSVPTLDNTYFGGRLVADEIMAVADRAIDRFNFLTAWKDRHGGYLDGAEAEFNKQNPVDKYVLPVLERYGLGKSGWLPAAELGARALHDPQMFLGLFPSPKELNTAIEQKMLDRDRARYLAAALAPYWGAR